MAAAATAASPVDHRSPRTPAKTVEEPSQPLELRRWEPKAKAQDADLKGSSGGVRSLACHDDLILTSSARPVVKVWQIAEDGVKETRKLRDGAVGSTCVQVNEEDPQMVSVCYDDGVIGLWDLRASQMLAWLESSVCNCWKAEFLTKGYRLVSGGTSGDLAIWDLRTFRLFHEVGSSESSSVLKKAEEANSAKRKKKSDGTYASSAETRKPPSKIFSLAASPDGKLLGCGRSSGDISVLHLETLKWAGDVSVHQGEVEKPVRGVCFDPNSKLLLGAGDDNHVSILDAASWVRPTENGEGRWPEVERFSAHKNSVSCAAVCPEPLQRVVLTTSWDGMVKLWDYSTHALLRAYKEHANAAVQAAAWSQKDRGGHFATAGAGGHIHVFAAS